MHQVREFLEEYGVSGEEGQQQQTLLAASPGEVQEEPCHHDANPGNVHRSVDGNMSVSHDKVLVWEAPGALSEQVKGRDETLVSKPSS